jgi:hypothetical protein
VLNRLRLRRPADFRRDHASVAAMEFALVLPVMLLLLGGVYDISELVIIRAEVYDAAQTMVASASNMAVQGDGSTALTYDQVQQVESSIWGLVPSLRSGQKVPSPLSITMSSLLFYPNPYQTCTWNSTSSCKYFADVAWSEGYVGTGTGATFALNIATTDCGKIFTDTSDQVLASVALQGTDNVEKFRTLGVTSDTTTASPSGAIANEAGVSPILAVSIQYTYQPPFTLYLPIPFTFWVDAYWPVRSVKTSSATTVNYGYGNVTVEPLSTQYTTLVGASGSGTTTAALAGSDVNTSAVCVNANVNPAPVSAPVT